jgi:hypothetical protein
MALASKGVMAHLAGMCTNRVIALWHKVMYPLCPFIKSGVTVMAKHPKNGG